MGEVVRSEGIFEKRRKRIRREKAERVAEAAYKALEKASDKRDTAEKRLNEIKEELKALFLVPDGSTKASVRKKRKKLKRKRRKAQIALDHAEEAFTKAAKVYTKARKALEALE